MSYRDDVDALSHQCSALEAEATLAAKRLDEARRLLEEAEQRRRLPVLDNIGVAAPCKASWDDMIGDDRTRHCGTCEKNVYDLSSMTRAQAEALLIEKEGKLCVRFYRRADGTILTADCPDGLTRRRRRMRVVAGTFGAMSALAAVGAMLFHRRPLVTMGSPMIVAPSAVSQPAPVKTMGKVKMPEHVMGEPTPTMGSVAPAPLLGHVRVERPKKAK